MDRDPTSYADVHSHLVPGVDDGARTLEEAMDAVERMTRSGIRKIITTPHLDGSLTLDPGGVWIDAFRRSPTASAELRRRWAGGSPRWSFGAVTR